MDGALGHNIRTASSEVTLISPTRDLISIRRRGTTRTSILLSEHRNRRGLFLTLQSDLVHHTSGLNRGELLLLLLL